MNSPSERSPTRKVELAVFVLHWVVVVAICVSAATGWRIAADDSYSAVGGLVASLQILLPVGSVHQWHVASGFAITIAATAYGLLIAGSGALRRVTDPVGIRRHYASVSGMPEFLSSGATWRILRIRTYQLAFFLVAIMAATGWILYFDAPLGARRLIANLHGIASIAFLLYACIHLLVQIKAGIFKSIFMPRAGKVRIGLYAIGAALLAYGLVYASRGSLVKTLEVRLTQQVPVLDGKADDTAWLSAKPLAIEGFRGANDAKTRVPMEVRAVRDAGHVYFLFKWSDPTLSRKYMPLIKEEGGWRVLQSGYDANDENGFYEDKFAVLFSRKSTIGSGTVHLGPGMRPGAHRKVTRGLHYTDDGSLVDVWHWKATRTAPMQPGLMDDNYFGPPMPSEKEGARYTGGYTQDPHTGGGYLLNWDKLLPSVALSDGYVVPKFLPKDPAVSERATISHAAGGDEDGPLWHMYKDDVVAYAPALDTYATGSVIPGVVIDGTFAGDRGDIRAEASWTRGQWTLEVKRKLDTASKYDVDFTQQEDLYFWIATFDNSQIRHSYHMQPGRIIFR